MADVPVSVLSVEQTRARWRWTPVAAYMAGIFALSSISQPPAFPGNTDKDLHALVYGGLAAFVVRALAGGWRQRVTWTTAIVAMLIAVLYGVSDEFHQSFVPNRQSDVRDVVADTVGAAIASSACVVWSRLWRSRWPGRSV